MIATSCVPIHVINSNYYAAYRSSTLSSKGFYMFVPCVCPASIISYSEAQKPQKPQKPNCLNIVSNVLVDLLFVISTHHK